MPIRPENRKRYPDDWKAISLRIRNERAAGQCECDGECASRDHTWWLRLFKVGAEPSPRCPNRNGSPSRFGKGSRVILTVAHLNHTPEDCRDENLKAMCQSCHLNYDREHHSESRRATYAAANSVRDAALAARIEELLTTPDDISDEDCLRLFGIDRRDW